ncbi:cytochrome b reductase 1-like [Limulus polyphemus]|uniref:Cytochrome b reductase 1-like n=1 Tax=Limulus polyphemus TaxID=6850 RepID=A0ABM1BGZ3_LIMPO|nr:cytochrome b reductase 1-like [Limulus polyphemus]
MEKGASNKLMTLMSYARLAGKVDSSKEETESTEPSTASGPKPPNRTEAPIDQSRHLKIFTVGFILCQVVGVLCVALVGAWTGHYFGGFAWQSDPRLQFNYHPLFIVIGLVFLYGNAILVYRVLRNERKEILKLVHAGIHTVVFIFTVVSLKAVFDSHNLAVKPIPNMFSLHSWLGLAAVVLFSLQFVCGFVSYLFPGLALYWRALYLPFHVYFGVLIYILGLASTLTGITEKLIFNKNYKDLPEAAVLGNILGMALVCHGILVVYLVTAPQFIRQPLTEEVNLTPDSSVN